MFKLLTHFFKFWNILSCLPRWVLPAGDVISCPYRCVFCKIPENESEITHTSWKVVFCLFRTNLGVRFRLADVQQRLSCSSSSRPVGQTQTYICASFSAFCVPNQTPLCLFVSISRAHAHAHARSLCRIAVGCKYWVPAEAAEQHQWNTVFVSLHLSHPALMRTEIWRRKKAEKTLASWLLHYKINAKTISFFKQTNLVFSGII